MVGVGSVREATTAGWGVAARRLDCVTLLRHDIVAVTVTSRVATHAG